jgi:hypothetical protein
MDATITYDEVAALIGTNIPLMEPHPTFESIRVLRRHFKCSLQHLPYPQSNHLGWKGLGMSCAMYVLLTVDLFCTPKDPGLAADYTCANPTNLTPLTRTEQASIDTMFSREKHYYHSMKNIKRACFTALDSSINDAFKVSNNVAIIGWHKGMTVQEILDQLSTISGQPTPAAIELNDVEFQSQYSAANAPKVLFRCIKNCIKIAILGQNPYTDHQLINNMICLLLTTGLYQQPFEEWDRLLPTTQMWIALQALIQEAFQRCLNTTTPTAGHHRYAPAHPYQQNAFGILGKDNDDNEANTVAMQMVALMYQSQLMQSTAANTSQHHKHQMAQLSAVQDATHVIINGMNALVFNASNAGHGRYVGRRYGGRRCGHGCMQGRGHSPPAYVGGIPHGRGFPQGGFSPTMGRIGSPMGAPPSPPGGFYGGNTGGPPHTMPPLSMNGGYGPTGGYGMPPGHPGMSPGAQDNVQPPYSNVVKQHANWNACYSCGFDVGNGHTSMSCLLHLRKVTHQVGFNCQNAQ